jgi:hypothetical protein
MEKAIIERDEIVELYNKLVATHPEAVRKGATIPYTSHNGHMYSFVTKEDVVALRLPDKERAKFLTKYKTQLVQQYGIIQKEYVVVPSALLRKTDELKQYFDMSYAYVSSLKPKPTSKGKKE